MYGFKYFIKGKIVEICKNVENVKGIIPYIVSFFYYYIRKNETIKKS